MSSETPSSIDNQKQKTSSIDKQFELKRLSGLAGPSPNWIGLVFGGLVFGGSIANIVALGGSLSYPGSLKIFNVLMLCLGILMMAYGIVPSIAYGIRKYNSGKTLKYT